MEKYSINSLHILKVSLLQFLLAFSAIFYYCNSAKVLMVVIYEPTKCYMITGRHLTIKLTVNY